MMSGRASRKAVCITALLTLGVMVLLSSPGTAHVKNGRTWLFYGSTYPKGFSHRVDPINIIFKGGGRVWSGRVSEHLYVDWGRGGTMKARSSGCKGSAQWMFWRDKAAHKDWDKVDMHRANHCAGRRFHFRLWDDYEHTKLTTSHTRYTWMVGNIHHERGTPHRIDMSYDVARWKATKKMRAHCNWRRWRRHPQAHRRYRRYNNSGWIARISMRHARHGCRGA